MLDFAFEICRKRVETSVFESLQKLKMSFDTFVSCVFDLWILIVYLDIIHLENDLDHHVRNRFRGPHIIDEVMKYTILRDIAILIA